MTQCSPESLLLTSLYTAENNQRKGTLAEKHKHSFEKQTKYLVVSSQGADTDWHISRKLARVIKISSKFSSSVLIEYQSGYLHTVHGQQISINQSKCSLGKSGFWSPDRFLNKIDQLTAESWLKAGHFIAFNILTTLQYHQKTKKPQTPNLSSRPTYCSFPVRYWQLVTSNLL